MLLIPYVFLKTQEISSMEFCVFCLSFFMIHPRFCFWRYWDSRRTFERCQVLIRCTISSGPNILLVKGCETTQQLLVSNVLKKSPIYDGFRPDPQHADLFTERDKDAHKHRVGNYCSSFAFSSLLITSNHPPVLRTCITCCNADGG